MQYELKLDNPPTGFAATTKVAGVNQGIVISKEFIYSDAGEKFISRLEHIHAMILARVIPAINPSQIKDFLILIDKKFSTKIFINDIQHILTFRLKRSVDKGDIITNDDIADIEEWQFKDISIPDDVAVIFYFSVDWRKGLFYDFNPILPNGLSRDYNLGKILGSCYAISSQPQFFNISDEHWEYLINSGWFPFISLPKYFLRNLINGAKQSADLDIYVQDMVTVVTESINVMFERWETLPEFLSHLSIIKTAATRFLATDYISCVSVLFIRIEGILRTVHSKFFEAEQPTQNNLAGCVIPIGEDDLRPFSFLLPIRFKQFLKNCYFADFQSEGSMPLSRNTVGHGVADVLDFNAKNSAIGFLILDQIFFSLKKCEKIGLQNPNYLFVPYIQVWDPVSRKIVMDPLEEDIFRN